ncbi:tRNA (guanine-N(7)-)-methyltransferase non-catalytic subunit wdr4 [Sphaeramia orbicularis]|uniref:Uncharacterized protein n=1 Tax=Sphaeramia orbicularis TaxID=375764 RepID=A0A672ZF67_9TELE|nr:tRNA (guanine-N(7)-)-methyltransferase non-catalytic subunit WDR4 [Sphaeramia orbicularis]
MIQTSDMSASVGFCSRWFISTCDRWLVAVDSKQDREPFVFDCSTAEKKPKNPSTDGDEGGAEETRSDRILAFAVSPCGNLVALTDDSKRLILFRCEASSWRCISVRFVVRRCTSLAFSQAEDQLLAADKSGDVYSFSVLNPDQDGELKMGHLSMVLAVTLSLDDRFIITSDRDEKIRVSCLRSPYNIQSFCLGHKQFISALLVPPGHSQRLVSGSGDGTLRLWEFESGRHLQSVDLRDLMDPEKTDNDNEKEKRLTVGRINISPDAQLIAVVCDKVSLVQFFSLDQDQLSPHSRLTPPHQPLDVTFDPEGRLWVLMDSDHSPLQIYTHRCGSWQCDTDSPDLTRVSAAFRIHWDKLDASVRTASRFDHLYVVNYDNVSEYMKKKQQRLDQQSQKRNLDQKRRPDAKKMKTPTANS